jgi:hypothetical protein
MTQLIVAFHNFASAPRKDWAQKETEQVEKLHGIKQCNCKVKNNKAPGNDSIPAELLKSGGVELNQRIYQIISQIWSKSSPMNGKLS